MRSAEEGDQGDDGAGDSDDKGQDEHRVDEKRRPWIPVNLIQCEAVFESRALRVFSLAARVGFIIRQDDLRVLIAV